MMLLNWHVLKSAIGRDENDYTFAWKIPVVCDLVLDMRIKLFYVLQWYTNPIICIYKGYVEIGLMILVWIFFGSFMKYLW